MCVCTRESVWVCMSGSSVCRKESVWVGMSGRGDERRRESELRSVFAGERVRRVHVLCECV